MVFLIGCTLEDQLFVDRGTPGAVINISLFIHFTENHFLPVLVVLLIVERIIIRGLVGDANDRCRLSQCEILDVLAEIGLGGNSHTPAAFAKINGIQIPLQDFLFVILFFQLQRAEDFRQLALYCNLILSGQVLKQLLRDGRAAITGLHSRKHLDKGTGSPIPVNALVFIKALVFDGNQGLLHIGRNVFVIDPDSTLISADVNALLPFPREVLVPDGACFTQLVVFEREIQVRCETSLYIICKNAGEKNSGNQQNQKNSTENAQNGGQNDGDGVHRITAGAQNLPQRAIFFQLFLR